MGADGRGESIWDRFCRVPGAVENGDTGDEACDHYAAARKTSPSWPAWAPTPTASPWRGRGSSPRKGRVEPRGLAHYDRFVDALLERGIKPLVRSTTGTCRSRSGPRRLAQPRHRRAFAEYAAVCFERLRRPGEDWVTVNEPWIAGLLGHQLGLHAPGEKDLRGRWRRCTTCCSRTAWPSPRCAPPAPAAPRVGIAYSLFPHQPADPASAADRAAARRLRRLRQPLVPRPRPRPRLPAPTCGATGRTRRGPLDFIRDGDLETSPREATSSASTTTPGASSAPRPEATARGPGRWSRAGPECRAPTSAGRSSPMNSGAAAAAARGLPREYR